MTHREETRGHKAQPTRAPLAAFTIIVPSYNERDSIGQVVESLLTCLKESSPYELIVVDDGSTDGSVEVAARLAQRYPHVQVLTHPYNRGYGAALKTGIRRMSTDLVVITDADSTYPNECIPALLEVAQEADMVVGCRDISGVPYPLGRRIVKCLLTKYASWIAGQPIPDINSGLRVMRRAVVEKFLNILPDGFSFTTTITLAMMTNQYDVRYVPISYAARVGRSKIKPIRDTLNFIQLILRTSMYFAPMRVFFPLAVCLGLLCMGCLAYDVVILRDLTDKTLLLLLFTMNTGMFALLADMLDKRSTK
jgi:glycosyltransferase involved in cell wall biosynthesis